MGLESITGVMANLAQTAHPLAQKHVSEETKTPRTTRAQLSRKRSQNTFQKNKDPKNNKGSALTEAKLKHVSEETKNQAKLNHVLEEVKSQKNKGSAFRKRSRNMFCKKRKRGHSVAVPRRNVTKSAKRLKTWQGARAMREQATNDAKSSHHNIHRAKRNA
jgi:hypothetical protein